MAFNANFVAATVDDEQELASQWGVLGMPTFLLFQNGAPIQQLVGSRPRKRLESELEEALLQQVASR